VENHTQKKKKLKSDTKHPTKATTGIYLAPYEASFLLRAIKEARKFR
jgi:hypothetical protein